MKPYYDDGQVTMYAGDVRDVLRELPAESVQMAVCSPPYWGLRDYGVEPTIWGGDEYHLHDLEAETGEWRSSPVSALGIKGTTRAEDPEGWAKSIASSGLQGGKTTQNHTVEPDKNDCVGQFCHGCGAWRGALGLEPTPELFIAHTVEVFREVRRVLRADGVLFLNIGDSYAGSWGSQGRQGATGEMDDRSVVNARISKTQIAAHPQFGSKTGSTPPGLKPKDLVGIPWMLAFALRADGWWLRQDIIWHKLNPMPESVRDRCTKAHEYVFLLSKSPRYHYDAKAIAEEAMGDGGKGPDDNAYTEASLGIRNGLGATTLGLTKKEDGRNKRSVWSIPTEPYPEAHFATYPTALVEPCILAGCPEGGVVLDPFLGSGTTALVARRLGRRCIGIDLNPEYLAMAVRRAGGQLSLELSEATS